MESQEVKTVNLEYEGYNFIYQTQLSKHLLHYRIVNVLSGNTN
jgi:hypothetical protein